ncbi:ketopantoate reductase family protein [Winogradskya humida]|uniref:Ketopantoate reductase n=1 Tax=Winogradskya humida TaxID=113566 RepID=A0ABQ4A7I3_9ACTN|nr:2-dehydropantoate 2-reductase N-terminal domain-containing protein [Actinoplanes humidus]GIE26588.1 ketopantoate reductase [Actinoplanes humidus]
MSEFNTRRYVVIGAGAVGGALAAQLVPAGHSVVLVARGEHGDRIATEGLTVRRPTGDEVVKVPVVSGPGELSLHTGDVLLLAVKTQDAEAAIADWAWRAVLDDTGTPRGPAAALLPIVTFQNGIATEDLALRRFERVYGATIAVAASYLSPGEIVSPSLDPAAVVWVGRYPGGSDPLQKEVVADLNASGIAAFSVDDIRAQKAAKLLGNLAANGTGLLEGPDDLRERARALLRDEAIEVLAAAGVPLPPGEKLDFHGIEFRVQQVEGHIGGRLSTWQSFARGASSEIDYLNGEIVLLARRHGHAAPLNRRLQELLGAAYLSDQRTLTALLSAAGA